MGQIAQLLGTGFYYAEAGGNAVWTSRSRAKCLTPDEVENFILRMVVDPKWFTLGLGNNWPKDKSVEIMWHEDVTPDKRSGARAQQAANYKKYEKLALHISSRFGKARGLAANFFNADVLEHLSTIVMDQWDDHDPDKASRTTWVYLAIHYHLKTMVRNFAKYQREWHFEGSAVKKFYDPPINPIYVGDDALFIMGLVEADPDRMRDEFKLPQEHRPFQEHLVSDYDWSWDRVNLAWTELEELYGWSIVRKKKEERQKRGKAPETSPEPSHSRFGACPKS